MKLGFFGHIRSVLAIEFRKYELRFQTSEGKQQVFDIIRKKYVALTPEEWVRQHWIHYLIYDVGYPKNFIGIEVSVKWNNLEHRCDLVVFDRKGQPKMIVECKAPEVNLSEKTAQQAARYNNALPSNYLLLTNGVGHYLFWIDRTNQTAIEKQELPRYNNL